MLYSMTRVVMAVAMLILVSGCDIFRPDKEYSVVTYEGPSIDAENARLQWTGTMQDERVTLRSVADSTHRNLNILILTLESVNDPLPDLADVWYGPDGGGVGRVVREARLYIQDWNVPGVVSGRLEVTLSSGIRMGESFWVEL